MDRQIVYPGAIPLETDLLNTNKYTMIGLAKLASALMGTATYVRGLSCTANSPPSMLVNVSAGEIYSLQNVDGTAYSSLAADTTHSILKQGIVMDSTSFTLTAPGTSGYSINYLIQATYTDTDSGATVLPYYNASNPSVAWSGPNNSGTAQNTVRSGVCTLSLKAGVAATTGTQVTPSPDAGYTGLYVITVAQGATTVTNSNINVFANAPFLPSAGIIDGIQRNVLRYGVDTGSANAYVVNINPGIASLTAGMEVLFRATNANTAASTLNVSALGAFPVLNQFGATLTAGEIAAGSLVRVIWSAAATSWFVLDSTGAIQTVTTAPAQTNSTQIASTAFVHAASGGVVGDARNLAMSVATASATATVTADEILVSSALGGSVWRIGSFSKTINLATTGAGGMDTGTVPANGFVGIYAIYNPTTGASALLAVNAAAAVGEVYGGNNMPAGYSASSLLTVVPTASSQFKVITVSGRSVYTAANVILSTSSNLSATQTSISSVAPMNAKFIEGIIALGSSGSGTLSATLNSLNTPPGIRQFGGYTPASASISSCYPAMPITLPGYIYISTSNATSGTASFVIYCSGYTI